jgi:hypothetical protein
MRFSRLSLPPSQNLSVSWSGSGYPLYDLGFSADGFDSNEDWFPILQKTLLQGLPVLVLQKYWFDDSGGHYRVVYGFNSTHIFSKDPWDREGQPRDLNLTYADFESLWAYQEKPENGIRFFGASLVPWIVSVNPIIAPPRTGFPITISFSYEYETPFPKQVIQDAPEAITMIFLQLSYDSRIWSAERDSISKKTYFTIGTTGYASFKMTCITKGEICQKFSPSIRASGIISSSLPSTVRTKSLLYPEYDYMDVIGSRWTKIIYYP